MTKTLSKQTRDVLHDRPSEETVKETFESIIVAFILAFVFRAYVVEAFVIPTGSMAPTLLGAHLNVQCQQCGYRFATDVPEHSIAGRGENRVPGQLRYASDAICPMCRFPNTLPVGTYPSAGDRILVQKYVYLASEPRRWDVVVFKYPHEPEINFIKRLIGLPGEEIHIFDGNIYAKPQDGPWQIARKTDRPKVQRRVWQPVYHSQYIPLDDGTRGQARQDLPWTNPWEPESPDGWLIKGRRSYRYDRSDPTRLNFHFRNIGDGGFQGEYPYNQFKMSLGWEPIEDIRLAVSVQPDQQGASIALSTTARLDSTQPDASRQTLTARIQPDGRVEMTATHPDGESRILTTGQTSPLSPGRTTEVELWYVDQHAILWIDGERVAEKTFDLPLDALMERSRPAPRPMISIDVAGSPLTLERVELDRDLYYSVRSPKDEIARGALIRNSGSAVVQPAQLGADEFFCMGDNSPWSHDSRYWGEADAWVRERIFDGRSRPGIVPRELLMGRAFFVYLPAPFSRTPGAYGVFPNFGDMRFIR